VKHDEIRKSIHEILDSHDDALAAIRNASESMLMVLKAHDAAVVSAIEANRAALRLLERIDRENGGAA